MARTGNIERQTAEAEHIGPDYTGDNVSAKKVANYETNDGVTWVRTGTPLASRLDDSADPIIYIGLAAVGSDEASAVWQIAKLDTSSGLSKTWASNAQFNQVWNDRTGLSYL